MHWIERHILKELAVADTRTYSELLPDGVEGNLFQYHARVLEKGGLISRSADGYSLTATGKELVGTMSLTRQMRRNDLPTPVVMIHAANEAGQILLFTWRRQPYRGLVSLPFGRLIRGRGLMAMAAEQLHYKSGYRAGFNYLGLVDLITSDVHLIVSVVEAINLTGQLGSDGLTGTSHWGWFDDVAAEQRLPGQAEILGWINDAKRPPLLELDLSHP